MVRSDGHHGLFYFVWLIPCYYYLKASILEESLDYKEAFELTMYFYTGSLFCGNIIWYPWLIIPATVVVMWLIVRNVYENEITYKKMLAKIESKEFDEVLDKILKEIGLSSEYKKDVRDFIILELGFELRDKKLAYLSLKDVVSRGVDLYIDLGLKK